MFNIKERPYGLLLLGAIVLSLAFVLFPNAPIDIKYITIFSVPAPTIAWIIPLLLLFFWLLYILTRRFLYSKTITWIHVLITVIATIMIVTVLYIGINPSQLANDRYELIGNVIQILSILFVVGQFAHLVNVSMGLFGKFKVL